MPTYDYECSRCSHRFELHKSFKDESPVSCPQCGCDARRMFSPVPIIFKGSGFYVTDHPGTHANSASTDKVAEKATESSKAAGDSKD